MKSRFLWKRLSWPLQVVVWLFSFYIAWNLIPAGYSKLMQDPSLVEYFGTLGLPAYLMIIVGVVEILGSVLLFIPKISYYGAISIFIVMGFASYFNGGATDTLTYGFLALIIAVLTRPGFLRKKPKITKISI